MGTAVLERFVSVIYSLLQQIFFELLPAEFQALCAILQGVFLALLPMIIQGYHPQLTYEETEALGNHIAC